MCGSMNDSFLAPAVTAIFGEYIDTFPFAEFVDRNIAFASIYLGESVADNAAASAQGFADVLAVTGVEVTGGLAAWAWMFIETVRILETDERIDLQRTGIYGHSRDGKAALLASAYSDRIDLVLAHQSGKGGAAPWQTGVGESVTAITDQYPFWFDPSFIEYRGRDTELPVDQHMLLALQAPKPVLISGARLDKWGDPVGSLQAAHSAAVVYELYGEPVTIHSELNHFDPEQPVAFFMRPWFHGVQVADWDAFFAFLAEHF